jgi:hypothetical protein
MPLDVLEYNQLATQYNTLVPLANTANTIAYSTWYSVAYANGLSAGAGTAGAQSLNCSPIKQNNFSYTVGCALNTTPWCCCLWANIPTLANTVGDSLRIFDTVEGRCGICCEWVVPAGATFARFEIWGAGAASKGNRCCGITMFGGSGAYASVILPVVPGCSYTLCAGCAECCCYCCTSGTLSAGSGCASFVNGYGLSNFCADGGDPNPANFLYNATRGGSGGIGGYCVLQNNMTAQATISKNTTYGYCICSWGGFSFTSNQCTQNDTFCRPTVSDRRWYGNLTIPATRGCHFVIGAPGMFACVAVASTWDGYRFFKSPPIVNITTATCSSCYLVTTIGGCVTYAGGAYQFPSRGGIGGNVDGGSSSAGLPGAAGLVCVYWV